GIRGRNVTGVQTCALPICQLAALDPQQGQTAQERGGVEVGHVRLQGDLVVVGGGRDRLDDGPEQGLDVLLLGEDAVGGLGGRGATGLAGGVDDGDVQNGIEVEVLHLLGEVGGQAQQQIGGLSDDVVDA